MRANTYESTSIKPSGLCLTLDLLWESCTTRHSSRTPTLGGTVTYADGVLKALVSSLVDGTMNPEHLMGTSCSPSQSGHFRVTSMLKDQDMLNMVLIGMCLEMHKLQIQKGQWQLQQAVKIVRTWVSCESYLVHPIVGSPYLTFQVKAENGRGQKTAPYHMLNLQCKGPRSICYNI